MYENEVEEFINVCSKRGGARLGAGRPTVDTKEVKLRLSPADHELLKALGSSKFVHNLLDNIRSNKVSFFLQLDQLSEEQKEAFFNGFVEAGGPEEETDNPNPWGAPWNYEVEIPVTGATPEEWGRSWWLLNRQEVASLTPVYVFTEVGGTWEFDLMSAEAFCAQYKISTFNASRFQKGVDKVDGVTYFLDQKSAERFVRQVFAGKEEEEEFVELVQEGSLFPFYDKCSNKNRCFLNRSGTSSWVR